MTDGVKVGPLKLMADALALEDVLADGLADGLKDGLADYPPN
jgi:hypothetical protein